MGGDEGRGGAGVEPLPLLFLFCFFDFFVEELDAKFADAIGVADYLMLGKGRLLNLLRR